MRSVLKAWWAKGKERVGGKSNPLCQSTSPTPSTLAAPPLISTASLSSTSMLLVVDGGEKARVTSTPRTLTEPEGKASSLAEGITAAENNESISTASLSSASVAPEVIDGGVASPTRSTVAPTQQLQAIPQTGFGILNPDKRSEDSAAIASNRFPGIPLANKAQHEPTISPAKNGPARLVKAVNSTKIESLWNKAANDPELSKQERKVLAEIGIEAETDQILSAFETVMAGILEEKKGKEWKIMFRGDELVLAHVGMKILHWVDKFKGIGDIIVQFDPVHAALPWAGFRFLLKVVTLAFGIKYSAYNQDP